MDGTYPAPFNHTGELRRIQHLQVHRPRPENVQQPRRGIIVKAYQVFDDNKKAVIFVGIRFNGATSTNTQDTEDKPFFLGHFVEDLAITVGELSDLIGLECKVEFISGRSDQGIAYLDNPNGRGNLEDAHRLPSFGTSLSPAGSG